MRHPVRAAGIAIALLLAVSGCTGIVPPPAATPFTMRLADIQSGTVRLGLHQVMWIDVGRTSERFSALIADERVVAVVQHRDETAGRFEPELIPLRIGTTQVALVSSIPGRAVVGFTVVVTEKPVT